MSCMVEDLKGKCEDILDDLKSLFFSIEFTCNPLSPLGGCEYILKKYNCETPQEFLDLVKTKCDKFLKRYLKRNIKLKEKAETENNSEDNNLVKPCN